MNLISLATFFLLFFTATNLAGQVRLIVKTADPAVSQASGWQNTLASLVQEFDIQVRQLFPENQQLSLGADGFDVSRYQGILLNDSLQMENLIESLNQSESVEWVEPDYKLELYEIPNDPLFQYQWFHNNTGQEYYGIDRYNGSNNDSLRMKHGVPGNDIGTPEARDKTAQKIRPLIVVVDTGLDWKHPDIADNLWTNPNEIADNFVDDDHNGYVDDVHGWDFSGDTIQFFNLEGDNDVADQHGHGTHVSGLAAAVSNNNIGVAGVASEPYIMTLKIFPNAFTSIGMQAILYAVRMGADVINISWGNYYPSKALEEILQYAYDNNVTVVTAIGNFADSTRTFPASYPTTITVGASTSDGETAYFSSFGSWLDVMAPGLDILSLKADTIDMYASEGEPGIRVIDENYLLADGSSMSAPIVSGAVAEILSYAPGLSPDSIRRIINSTANDIVYPYPDSGEYPGFDNFSGWGQLNLAAALDLVGGHLAKIDYPRPFQMIESSLPITGTAFSQANNNFELNIYRAGQKENKTLIASGVANIVRDTIAEYNDWIESGQYVLELTVDGQSYKRSLYYINEPIIEIKSPADGDTVSGVLTFRGTVAAPGYQNCRVVMYPVDNPILKKEIIMNTGFVVDSIIGKYTLNQSPEGEYICEISMTTDDDVYSQDLDIFISNGFAQGFPTPGRGLLNYAPAVYDLDRNGRLETVVTSRGGIGAYNHIGGYVPGRWPWMPPVNVNGPPVVYDINNDGLGEIAYASENTVNLVGFDGFPMSGFPKEIPLGSGQYGYPALFMADMDNDSYQEIIAVTMDGDVYAYRHDGSSYFASLNGFFAAVPGYMREYVPIVICDDFNGDYQKEIVVMMSDAISIYNTHNGIKPFWLDNAQISDMNGITGACAADFDADGLLEIGFIGRESEDEKVFVAIMEADGTYFDGFPMFLPNVINQLVNFPAVADLDNNGKAEIVVTTSAMDFSQVWIIESDATAWQESTEMSADSYFSVFAGTAGPPAIADVNGDSILDIVVRQGNFYPGINTEKIYAFDLNGQILEGWPRSTLTDANRVLYRVYMPTITNLGTGADTLFSDLLVTADDTSIYAWKLPARYDTASIAWGQYQHDSRHSGIYPPTVGYHIDVPVDYNPDPPTPAGFYLSQNYPNPFNAETVINFSLIRGGEIGLDVYNILGRKVANIASGYFPAGNNRVQWEAKNYKGEDIASGIYFYKLKTTEGVITRKMLLIK